VEIRKRRDIFFSTFVLSELENGVAGTAVSAQAGTGIYRYKAEIKCFTTVHI
jgi:hypothetical protein